MRSWDLGEIDRQMQETAAMELCDAQSFQYEVTFSRLTLKQLKKLAAEKRPPQKETQNSGEAPVVADSNVAQLRAIPQSLREFHLEFLDLNLQVQQKQICG